MSYSRRDARMAFRNMRMSGRFPTEQKYREPTQRARVVRLNAGQAVLVLGRAHNPLFSAGSTPVSATINERDER